MAKTVTMEEKTVGMHAAPVEIPPEKGWAWMVLIACFLCRILNDGLIGSLGVFIVAWQDYFSGSMTELTWIASLLAGITYIVGPLGSMLLKRFSIRQVVMAGAILTCISFIAASFATCLWHLYVTSTIAGLGLGLSYQPSFVVLSYYFNKRLGLACGLTSAGSAVGMLIIPPLFQILISYYRWQGAILILAGFVANIGVCASLYRPTALEIKARRRRSVKEPSTNDYQQISSKEPSYQEINHKEPSRNLLHRIMSSIIEHSDFALLNNVYFVSLTVGYFLYGLSYIVAFHYLAARAVDSGTSELNAAYLVSAIGVGSCISRLTHGLIIDHHILSATVLTSLSYFLCGVSCIFTPLSDEYVVLAVFAVLIGLSSGVYHSTFPIIAKDYVGLQHISGAIGWILLMCGCGVILGSYLTGVLVDATGTYDFPFYLAGVCFMFCALFTSTLPISQCLRRHLCPNKRTQDLEEGSKWTQLYAETEEAKETHV